MNEIWIYYLAACAGLLLVGYRMVRVIKPVFVRWPVWGLVAGIALTPYSIGTDYPDYYAPAVIMFALEGLFEGEFARAGLPLAVGTAMGCLCGLAIAFAVNRYQQSAQASSTRPG